MAEDFGSAALHHRHDARRLAGIERFQNAGYMIGLAAECLAKSLLVAAGIPIGNRDAFRRHFPRLAEQLRVDGRTSSMRLLAPIVARQDFLHDWDIEARYDPDLPPETAQQRFETWEANVGALFNAAGLP